MLTLGRKFSSPHNTSLSRSLSPQASTTGDYGASLRLRASVLVYIQSIWSSYTLSFIDFLKGRESISGIWRGFASGTGVVLSISFDTHISTCTSINFFMYTRAHETNACMHSPSHARAHPYTHIVSTYAQLWVVPRLKSS